MGTNNKNDNPVLVKAPTITRTGNVGCIFVNISFTVFNIMDAILEVYKVQYYIINFNLTTQYYKIGNPEGLFKVDIFFLKNIFSLLKIFMSHLPYHRNLRETQFEPKSGYIGSYSLESSTSN